MASFYAHLMNYIFKKSAKPAREECDFLEERKKHESEQNVYCSNILDEKEITLNGVAGEVITNKKYSKDKIVYYIHGGGFATGSYKERRRFTYYVAKKYGYTIYACDYRLSPENKWPCHLEDCLNFYKGLLKKYKGKDIIFVGESAGGTLVLSLALKLRDEGLELPCGIIAFSPVVSQTEGYLSRINNKNKDTMIGLSYNLEHQNKIIFNNQNDLNSTYASPILGNYSNLPPIYLNVSDNEIFYDDSIKLYDKLKNEKHQVYLEVKKNLFHAYPVLPFVKEAKETINNAFNFIENQCKYKL